LKLSFDSLAVVAAIYILGEEINLVNGLGLVVVIVGVALFNMIKYQRLRAGEIPSVKRAGGRLGRKSNDGANTILTPQVVSRALQA
jgi:hypothetical protein